MKLTKKEVEKIADLYDLGKVRSFWEIKSGLVNYNFDFKTDKGRFIIRVLKGASKKDKKIEFKILYYLKKKSYPYQTPVPIKNNKGGEISIINNKKMWVYEKIQGKYVGKMKKHHIKQVANSLALYHKIVKNIKGGKIPYWTKNISYVVERFEPIKRKKSSKKIDKLMKENIDLLIKLSKKLKILDFNKNCLYCNCDINKSNLLWKKGKLIGVIDFDNIVFAPRMFDVAVAVMNMNDTRIRKKNYKLFLDEYKKVNKLTKKEIDRLYYFMIRYRLSALAWFYKGMEKEPKKRYNYIKWCINFINRAVKEINLS